MATDSDYQRIPPKKVKQKSWATCWAAAFSSILDATDNPNKKTEKELVDTYANMVGGGIQPKILGDIAKDFGFIFNIFLDKNETRVFSDSLIIQRLKLGGPLLAAPKVLNLGGGMPGYHAQVIYGVTYLMDADQGTGNALLKTMNPATGLYQLYPLSYFTQNTPLFTCWKNT